MPAPVDLSAIRGRSCLITGGASGLGLATTTRFAAYGAYVTIADVQDKLGEEVVAKLTAEGQKVSYVHCDITNWESSMAAFKHAIDFSPSKTLDIVALYAGVGGKQRNLVEHTKSGDPNSDPVAPTHLAIDVNLLGSYYSTSLALHYLQTSEEETMQKSLILVASLAGYMDYPNTDYTASKYATRGIFRSIRSRAPELGIRVNMICPWFIQTPMTAIFPGIFKERGIEPGKNFSWASIDSVVDAASVFAVDEKVSGRSHAIMPEGYVDLDDNEEEGGGGTVFTELMKKRMVSGDMIV